MTPHLIRALRREIRDAYREHVAKGSVRPFRVDVRRLEEESDDLFPDSVCHGDIVVAEVKYVSRYRVTERKEEYEARDEEWPYRSDQETAGEIDIVQVEDAAK